MEGKSPHARIDCRMPSAGNRMPAEWEPHEATWISWPKNLETFPKDIIGKVEDTFVEMVRALYSGEKVNILVNDVKNEETVRSRLESAGIKTAHNIIFRRIVSSDVWIRDYGPTFVRSSSPAGTVKAIKWTYNAYGEKYDDLAYDDTTGEEIVKASGKDVIRPDLILEGGSIEVNGKGTLITTEQCLLNKNRNSKLKRAEIETKLETLLGVKNIIWLGEGVVGDDTDGHIDDIARFVGDRKVVCAIEPNKSDENHLALKKDFETLAHSKDQDGEPLDVIALPMPAPVTNRYGRLPASYANFYIGNKAVLLPVFKDKSGADEKAVAILEECFKGQGRRVIPIDARYLVWGLGTIHCSTQQQPR